MIKYRVCLIGATAVGKTAIFHRLLTGYFDPNYVTTIGVATDEYIYKDEETEVHLNLIDTEGHDGFQALRLDHLKDSHGYFLVIDGTRIETLEIATLLLEKAKNLLGNAVPFVCLMNKYDLRNLWKIDEKTVNILKKEGWDIFETSAKSGEGLVKAMRALVKEIIHSMALAKNHGEVVDPVKASMEKMIRELDS